MDSREDKQYFLRIEKIAKGQIEGYGLWDEIPLRENGLVIGRPTKNPGMIVPDIKVMGDDSVTRGNHASIIFSEPENGYKICDRHSSYGTFLDGKLLEKNVCYTLKDNMLIGLCGNRVLFRFRDSCSSLPPENVTDDPRKPLQPILYFNLKAKEVTRDNVKIDLTKNDFKVLEFLYINLEKACSIESIANYVWGDDYARIDSVTQYIRRLRKKIEQTPSEPRHILTVPGRHGCYLLKL